MSASQKNARKISVVQTRMKKDSNAGEDLKYISRNDLEKEVLSLRETLKAMKRGETTDKVSGLSNRATFLDTANAEFARSRRYNHDLSLVVTDMLGLAKIADAHGDEAVDHTIMAVAQMCVSSSRYGVDVLGRITANQIAILLPETNLAGGLKFMSRMRKIITTTPIYLPDGGRVKPGLKVSADMLHPEDESFIELFQRTWKRTGVKKKAAKKEVA